MDKRRLFSIDKIVIAICCIWLIGWILLGVTFAVDVFGRQISVWQAVRKASAVLALFASIGCIALIGLWPHRGLLLHQGQSERAAFVVETKKREPN